MTASAEAREPADAKRAGARLRAIAWAAVGAYLATIFYLSSLSNPLPDLTAAVWDKVLHTCEYGGLGLLLTLALRASGVGARRALLLAVIGASLYGASDEFHQSYVPGRSSDVQDWAADTFGGALGALAATGALRVRGARASIRRPTQGV